MKQMKWRSAEMTEGKKSHKTVEKKSELNVRSDFTTCHQTHASPFVSFALNSLRKSHAQKWLPTVFGKPFGLKEVSTKVCLWKM